MQRRRDPGVIEALLAEPQRFGFFQAVRLMELHFARQGGQPGRDAVAARMRFLNSPSLAFPPSELAGALAYDDQGELLADPDARREAILAGKLGQVALTPAFFGLLGAQGALPLHYSEALAQGEARTRERGARAFFDIFSNRAAALFYRAWKKYRLALRHETDRDHHYLPLLLSLAGLGHPALRRRMMDGPGQVHDEAIAHFAAAVRQRPVSAEYLQRVLSDYFGEDLRVEQFVGRWYDVPPEHRTVLGAPGAVLGVSAFAGDRIWQRDMCLRLRIGPLKKEAFAGFLPGGSQAQALEKLLLLLGGPTFEYEIKLVLAKEEVGNSQLSDEDDGQSGTRLGWNSFLCTEAADQDRDDAGYGLNTIH